MLIDLSDGEPWGDLTENIEEVFEDFDGDFEIVSNPVTLNPNN